MKYHMASMEGLAGYIYRDAYHACYHPMGKYSTPSPSPRVNSGLSFRGLNDILPEHNQSIHVVPQILTNQAKDFIRTTRELQKYGYSEISPNLGCPSGTAVSKYKGTGFLGLSDSLDRFLDEVYGKMEGVGTELSVKTKLGLVSPDEFTGLLEIYNHYPLEKLILHPRVHTDYYKNTPNMPALGGGFGGGRAPVCYNGGIFTVSGYETLRGNYSKLDRVMLGYGVISGLGLLDRIVARADSGKAGTSKEALRKFHQVIYGGCRTIASEDRNILFKMKELWACIIQIFSDNGKCIKRIKKSQRSGEYEVVAAAVFRDLDIMEGVGSRTY